jgi:hypothetical protein
MEGCGSFILIIIILAIIGLIARFVKLTGFSGVAAPIVVI